jgi:hypothetical protein
MAAALGRAREGRLAGRTPRLADPRLELVSGPVVISATDCPGVPGTGHSPCSALDVGELLAPEGVRVGRAAAESGSGSSANEIFVTRGHHIAAA